MNLNNEELQTRAREFALANELGKRKRRQSKLRSELQSDMASLQDFAHSLAHARCECKQPAEDWLIDHATFLDIESQEIEQKLSPTTFRQLPVLQDIGTPRIYAMCDDYLRQVDGHYDVATFESYITAYQEVSVLQTLECWLLPTFMRMAMISRLAKKMREVRHRHEVCASISALLGRIGTPQMSDTDIRRALDGYARNHAFSPVEVVHLVRHLSEWEPNIQLVRNWLAAHMENREKSLEQMVSFEHQFQAELQVSCGNLVTSLHVIDRRPWRATLTKISHVEQCFLANARTEFARMDFSSRDLAREKVAHLARRLKVPETLVAQTALSLADKSASALISDVDAAHRDTYFAYYLFNPHGVARLRKALSDVVRPRPLRKIALQRRPFTSFIGSASVLFVAFMVLAAIWVTRGHEGQMSIWSWIAVFAVLAIPMSEWTLSFLHAGIERVFRPTMLLRYDFSDELPDDARTMVVMPVIWSSVEEVDDVMDRLLVHYLSNRQKHIHFAVLADFTDAPSEMMAGDDEVVRHAADKIEQLRQRYGRDKFFLFHRSRLYNKVDNIYMGWERKRGKLVEFALLLGGQDDTTYTEVSGDTSVLPKIRYIFTVDHDTKLPMGTVSRMAGTIHHPYNRPRLNDERTRVIDGFGILQPRVAMSYESTQKSRFAQLWAGEPGIDPYAFAASNPYQDLFGQVAFVGKGIFDVEAFRVTLAHRIPDNRVLSHDLLEGGFLRTGFVSDVEVIEDYPATVYAYQRRAHRWIRGDWQLFHWLGRTCKNRDGERQQNDLCGLTRFHIADNMRRSLVAPVLFLVALLGLQLLPGRAIVWESVVLLTIFLPFWRTLFQAAAGQSNWRTIGVSLGQSMVQLISLPFTCVVTVDAILRAMYRMSISRRKLLEWVPAQRTNRHLGQRAAFVNEFCGYILVALFVVSAGGFGGVTDSVIGGITLAVWIAAHPLMRWMGRGLTANCEWIDGARPHLQDWSKQIWAFYERYVTADESWLPPDNVQYHPHETIAHRTSPTNIGLYLMCVIAARDLGFIDNEGMATRLERSIRTVCSLEKWNGHLLNWYDTETGLPLAPRYASTVDSGNFVAYLMVVRQAVLETIDCGEQTLRRLEQLVQSIDGLVEQTNFQCLYDSDDHLFALGFHVDENRRETILYDLLASEARQASFVAIALGQIPVSHWFALGRAMSKACGSKTLLSWSGTMFEYLMPSLIMRTYRRTIWDATYTGVVRRQEEYADISHVPFGISESGYYAFDYQLNYQYRAFGVPGLGLDRGLEKNLVVAPYATILALPYAGDKGLLALHQLAQLGLTGEYGFYEAVDFTLQRMPQGRRHQVIQSFMAHHQGMSMLTLANLLCDDVFVERFHADPHVRAADLLLQERIPKKASLVEPRLDRNAKPPEMSEGAGGIARVFEGETNVPEVNVLSNERMTSVSTNRGNGMLTWNGLAITRWREDPVVDTSGPIVYIHDVHREETWTPTDFPVRLVENPKSVFRLDKVEYVGEYKGITSKLDVVVASDMDAEIRQLRLTNQSDETRTLEVTSFLELALASQAADVAHPAFSKLFVQTSHEVDEGCLVAKRRARETDEQETFAVHTLYTDALDALDYEFETDRSSFVGRGYSLAAPKGITERLRGSVGSVADPAFVMRRTVQLEPGETTTLYMVTSAAETRGQAIEIVRRLRDASQVKRAFHLAWVRTQIDLRHLNLSPQQAMDAMRLASRLLYAPPLKANRREAIHKNSLGQSALWPRGLSGDAPILTIRVTNLADLAFVTLVARQHQYLCARGLAVDLVILDETEASYQDALMHQVRDHLAARGISEVKRLIGLKAHQLDAAERTLLQAVSRVWLRAGGPSLPVQLRVDELDSVHARGGRRGQVRDVAEHSPVTLTHARSATEGEFPNGFGRFINDGKAYQIEVQAGAYLPRPWSNVLANPNFGCVVTELGTGYSWWKNSRECKLTPWSNDAVIDPAGECIYLRDMDTDEVWTATPKPAGDGRAYTVTHGHGYTQIEQTQGDVRHQLDITVPMEHPLKVMRLQLQNTTDRPKRIAITHYAEWVLGVQREAQASFVVTEWDESLSAFIAQNKYQSTFRDARAFLYIGGVDGDASDAPSTHLDYSWTGDRTAFIGRAGSRVEPDLVYEDRLTNTTGAFSNACGAVQTMVELPANGRVCLTLLLGCADSQAEVAELVGRYGRASAYDEAIEHVHSYWDGMLSQVQVRTPDRAMDVMLNGWLLYQALSCRLWARTAFYQAGGAFGFRDQLQDAIAFLHTEANITRQQILHNAGHQYEEGDVQHWWHEETQKGIRTRFSDDLLWLPYAVSRYIEHTEDFGILQEEIPFLHSLPLKDDESERYEDTVVSSESGTILDHCLRAISKSLHFGEHGIPLMGIGDWNDGMNRVGANGKGESVWLGWFLIDILERFIQLGEEVISSSALDIYQRTARDLRDNLNRHAWDGGWFRRAYTDAGVWLGSREDRECRIDAIAQSWSVISAGSTEDRARRAMRSFDRELVDRELDIARLLTPPFDEMDPSPGYIEGYPPGIRENGGQYTHGVIWSIVAWAMLGRDDKAWELFSMLNPITHTRTSREVLQYGNEPYVMSADVYTAPPHQGRAGWSWYTGAAGWMYQAGLEYVLGVRRQGDRLYIQPCVPVEWDSFGIDYRFGQTMYSIEVDCTGRDELVPTWIVDGRVEESPYLQLMDDGETHHVLLRRTRPSAAATVG